MFSSCHMRDGTGVRLQVLKAQYSFQAEHRDEPLEYLTTDSYADVAMGTSASKLTGFIPPPPEVASVVTATADMGRATCQVYDRALHALKQLSISGAHMDPRTDRCYCSLCFSGPELFPCGVPERNCMHPVGWVRFGVRALETHVDTTGYVSYHGTKAWTALADGSRACLLEKIFRNKGQLMHPGMRTVDGEQLRVPTGHYRDGEMLIVSVHDKASSFPRPKHRLVARDLAGIRIARETALGRTLTPDEISALRFKVDEMEAARFPGAGVFLPNRCLFTSPSIKYASQLAYAAAEAVDGTEDRFQFVLELRQRTDSFLILAETLSMEDNGHQCDVHVPNDELEWCTDILTAVTITGLLVRRV